MRALAALIPSLGVGLLFWYTIRAIISADRNERKALAELDRHERQNAASTSAADVPVEHGPSEDAPERSSANQV